MQIKDGFIEEDRILKTGFQKSRTGRRWCPRSRKPQGKLGKFSGSLGNM